jgi:hypothetical protein
VIWVRERVAAWAYLLGWKVVCRLPQRWADWAFRQVADWVWWRRGPGSGSWKPTWCG